MRRGNGGTTRSTDVESAEKASMAAMSSLNWKFGFAAHCGENDRRLIGNTTQRGRRCMGPKAPTTARYTPAWYAVSVNATIRRGARRSATMPVRGFFDQSSHETNWEIESPR